MTLVIRLPGNSAAQERIQAALDTLRPYCTGTSMEDDMTVLDLIEQHDDFDSSIAEQAREQTIQLHKQLSAALAKAAENAHPADNPFYSGSIHGQAYYAQSAEDRLVRVKCFTSIEQCDKAEAIPGIQKTVLAAIRRQRTRLLKANLDCTIQNSKHS